MVAFPSPGRGGRFVWHNPLRLHDPKSHMTFMMLVFIGIGLTLVLQAARYSNTPSYANLLDILPAQAWGGLYLAAAALKLAAILRYHIRSLVIITHTVTIALIAVWLAAFIVRWFTDSGTTIVNVTSWATYLYLTVRSAIMTDDDLRTWFPGRERGR